MPDWEEIVQRRLGGLALEGDERREVVAELAAHLEDVYEGLRGAGVQEEEAARAALAQVNDWEELERRIHFARNKEGMMKNRVRELWFPGFLTLTLSMSLLFLLQKFGFQPRFITWTGPIATQVFVPFYIPWLVLLPLVGALGAIVSSRAGGSRRAMLSSGVFPTLCLAALFALVFPLSFVIDRHVPLGVKAEGFLSVLVGWVAVPGAALLVGGLLAQFLLSRRLGSRRIAGS